MCSWYLFGVFTTSSHHEQKIKVGNISKNNFLEINLSISNAMIYILRKIVFKIMHDTNMRTFNEHPCCFPANENSTYLHEWNDNYVNYKHALNLVLLTVRIFTHHKLCLVHTEIKEGANPSPHLPQFCPAHFSNSFHACWKLLKIRQTFLAWGLHLTVFYPVAICRLIILIEINKYINYFIYKILVYRTLREWQAVAKLFPQDVIVQPLLDMGGGREELVSRSVLRHNNVGRIKPPDTTASPIFWNVLTHSFNHPWKIFCIVKNDFSQYIFANLVTPYFKWKYIHTLKIRREMKIQLKTSLRKIAYDDGNLRSLFCKK